MSRVTINVNGLSLVHEDSGGVSTATLPDVCLTPGAGAVPYPNGMALSRDLAGGSSARARGRGPHRIAVAGSSCARSAGGEPGSGGGGHLGGQRPGGHVPDPLVRRHHRGPRRVPPDRQDAAQPRQHDQLQRSPPECRRRVAGARRIRVSGSTSRPTKKSPHVVVSAPQMTYGLDTNLGSDPDHHALNTAYALSQNPSCTFVGRYLIAFDEGPHRGTSNKSNPGLTPHEAEAGSSTAGMTVFAIWELTKYPRHPDGHGPGPVRASAQGRRRDGEGARWRGSTPTTGPSTSPSTSAWIRSGGTQARDQQVAPRQGVPICEGLVGHPVGRRGRLHAPRISSRPYFQGIGDVALTREPHRRLRHPDHGDEAARTSGSSGGGGGGRSGPTRTPYTGKIDQRAQLLQISTTANQDPAGDNTFPWGVSGAGALDLDSATQTDFGQWPIAKAKRGAPQ